MKTKRFKSQLTVLIALSMMACVGSDSESGVSAVSDAPAENGYGRNQGPAANMGYDSSGPGPEARSEELSPAAPSSAGEASGDDSSTSLSEGGAVGGSNEAGAPAEPSVDADDTLGEETRDQEVAEAEIQWIQLSTDDSTSMASAQIFKSGGYYGRGLKVHEFLNYYDPPSSLFAGESFARAKAIDESIRFGLKADYQPLEIDESDEETRVGLIEVEDTDAAEDDMDSSAEDPGFEEPRVAEPEPAPAPVNEAVGELEVLFQMQADPVAKADRRNWNLFLCVDVSGSMNGEKMEFTIDALTQIIPHLKTGDRLTLTTFNNDAQTLFSDLEISENESRILSAFRGLRANGGTNMTAGLRESYALAQENYDPEMLQRVILFGDGSANVGDTDIRTFTQLTRINGQEGIYLSGVGVGTGYDFQRMDQLTDAGKGAHIFLPNQAEVDIIFGDYFAKLVEVSADSIAVEATLPAGIELAAFSGEEVSFDPNQRLQNIVLAAGDDMTFTAKFRVLDEAALDEPLALKVTLRPLATGEEIIRKIEVDTIRELIDTPGRLFERTRLVHRFGKFAANGEGDLDALRTDLENYENPDWGIREIIELLARR